MDAHHLLGARSRLEALRFQETSPANSLELVGFPGRFLGVGGEINSQESAFPAEAGRFFGGRLFRLL